VHYGILIRYLLNKFPGVLYVFESLYLVITCYYSRFAWIFLPFKKLVTFKFGKSGHFNFLFSDDSKFKNAI